MFILSWIFGGKANRGTKSLGSVFRQFGRDLQFSLGELFTNIQPRLTFLIKDKTLRWANVVFQVLQIFVKDSIRGVVRQIIENLEKYLVNNEAILNNCATFIIVAIGIIIVMKIISYLLSKKSRK